jgi:hypothetical protein
LFDIVQGQIDGKDIIRAIVPCGQQRPYYVRKLGMSEQGCFVRVGSFSQPMSEQMIEELLSKRQRITLQSMASPRQNTVPYGASLRKAMLEAGIGRARGAQARAGGRFLCQPGAGYSHSSAFCIMVLRVFSFTVAKCRSAFSVAWLRTLESRSILWGMLIYFVVSKQSMGGEK